jgi:hypothetical protein
MPLFSSVPRPRPLPWIQAALLGLPLVFLGLSLLLGDPSMAGTLILASVICTAGIGGLFWLALALVIGLAVLYAADQMARQGGRRGGLGLFPQDGEIAGAELSASAQQQRRQMLVGYVFRRRKAAGVDGGRLRQELAEAGWSPAQIEEAFALAERL